MIDQPVSEPVSVYQVCDDSAAVVTKVTEGDSVRVISSLAGGSQTCYKVRLTRGDEKFEGYVIGPVLPEIEVYRVARQADLKTGRFVQPPPPPPLEAPKPPEALTPKPETPVSQPSKPTSPPIPSSRLT